MTEKIILTRWPMKFSIICLGQEKNSRRNSEWMAMKE